MNVLLVEDEERIASFVSRGLRQHGYDVRCVMRGAEADEEIDRADLVLLDLGLPDMDGVDVLRLLRTRRRQLPVIVLTARAEVEDRVSALDEGADDYLVKPFAFEELLARIRARVRTWELAAHTSIEAGGIVLDLLDRTVRVDERPLSLTTRQFDLLEVFVRERGNILARSDLLARIWGIDFDPGTNVVDVHVGHLRRKVGAERIETIKGVGYRLRA
jgi:two-component system copper resistance phosphate regulon response regulator CusR